MSARATNFRDGLFWRPIDIPKNNHCRFALPEHREKLS